MSSVLSNLDCMSRVVLILTSFFMVPMIKALSWSRDVLIRARRLRSATCLLTCKEISKQNELQQSGGM